MCLCLLMQEVKNEKPIATPWLKETHESEEATGNSLPEAYKHTRAAVEAITDANLDALSPPSLLIEKQPPSPLSPSSFPVPASTAPAISNFQLPAHGILTTVSEKREDEGRVQQSATDEPHKRHFPLLPPRYRHAPPLKRRISLQAMQNSNNLTVPSFFRSKSLQHEPGNVFGQNMKQVEHVLQRMADAIKMDLQHEV